MSIASAPSGTLIPPPQLGRAAADSGPVLRTRSGSTVAPWQAPMQLPRSKSLNVFPSAAMTGDGAQRSGKSLSPLKRFQPVVDDLTPEDFIQAVR